MYVNLHNKTRYSTRKILIDIIKKKSKKEIYLIVGRGLHSENKKPILKNFVMNYLKSKNIDFKICEKSKGGIIIMYL